MITFSTNMSEVIATISDKISRIDADRISLMMAQEVLPELRKRIHVRGEGSDGSQIGVYSDGYMKVRTGDFGNRKKITRGKNKGQSDQRSAGVFTKGANKGKPRPLYNRTDDKKVVASLTREMEDGMLAIPLGNGKSGIGWLDKYNFDKSQWVEETYKKNIYQPTEEEREIAIRTAKNEVERILS